MSLYVGDIDVVLPLVFTTSTITGTDVQSVKVRVETGGSTIEWDLTPTATTATSVTCQRVLEAADLPRAGRYHLRAWFYGAGAVLLGASEEFDGPEVRPSRVSPPA